MITELTLPDGSRIWLALGDTLSGPGDYFGPLHLNATSTWVSVNGGHWKHCQQRRLHQAIESVEQCQTADDVRREVCCD